MHEKPKVAPLPLFVSSIDDSNFLEQPVRMDLPGLLTNPRVHALHLDYGQRLPLRQLGPQILFGLHYLLHPLQRLIVQSHGLFHLWAEIGSRISAEGLVGVEASEIQLRCD